MNLEYTKCQTLYIYFVIKSWLRTEELLRKIIPILYLRKRNHGKVKWLVYNYTARKCQSQNSAYRPWGLHSVWAAYFLLINVALPLALDLPPHRIPSMPDTSLALVCSHLFSCPLNIPLNDHSASWFQKDPSKRKHSELKGMTYHIELQQNYKWLHFPICH